GAPRPVRGARRDAVAGALLVAHHAHARAHTAHAGLVDAGDGGAPHVVRVAALGAVAGALMRARHAVARARPGHAHAHARGGGAPHPAGVAGLHAVAHALRLVGGADAGARAGDAGLVDARHRRPPRLGLVAARRDAVAHALDRAGGA